MSPQHNKLARPSSGVSQKKPTSLRSKSLGARLGVAGLTLMMIAPPLWALPADPPDKRQRSADRQERPKVRGHSKPARESRSERRREGRRDDRSQHRGSSASQRGSQGTRREGHVSRRQEPRREHRPDRRQERRHEVRVEGRQERRQEQHNRRADPRQERRHDSRNGGHYGNRSDRNDHRYDRGHRRGHDYRSNRHHGRYNQRQRHHGYNRDHYRVKRGYESRYHRQSRHRDWIRRQNRAWYDCNDYGGFFVRLGRYLDYRFDIPRLIRYEHLDRYDEYYYGQVYHGPHDEIYDVYLFPVYHHDRVEYRPYVYCEGKFFGRARFDAYGGLDFEVGFRF